MQNIKASKLNNTVNQKDILTLLSSLRGDFSSLKSDSDKLYSILNPVLEPKPSKKIKKAPKRDKVKDSKSFDESLSSFFTSIKGITSVISRATEYSEETPTEEILKDILEAGENIGQMKSSIDTVMDIDSENLTGKVKEVTSATAVVLGPLLVKEILKK